MINLVRIVFFYITVTGHKRLSRIVQLEYRRSSPFISHVIQAGLADGQ